MESLPQLAPVDKTRKLASRPVSCPLRAFFLPPCQGRSRFTVLCTLDAVRVLQNGDCPRVGRVAHRGLSGPTAVIQRTFQPRTGEALQRRGNCSRKRLFREMARGRRSTHATNRRDISRNQSERFATQVPRGQGSRHLHDRPVRTQKKNGQKRAEREQRSRLHFWSLFFQGQAKGVFK